MTHDRTPSAPERAIGALLGHAVGDALGAPTEGMSRAQIRSRWGAVTDFLSDDPAGTDDTEYGVLTARGLLTHGLALTSDDVAAMWRSDLLGQDGGFAGGGFSELVAIDNLRRGLEPPVSGADSFEQWSDGAAMRMSPVGIVCAGDPVLAARLAAVDASVSHARDGIICAQSIAAATAVAMVSDDADAVVRAAIDALPVDSWSWRTITRAIDIATSMRGPAAVDVCPDPATALAAIDPVLDRLEAEIPVRWYPWADTAPEATALALAVFAAAHGEHTACVLGGTNIGRDADTIAAMAGGLAGALRGVDAIQPAWRARVGIVRGTCIRSVAGTDLTEMALRLLAVGGAR